MGGVAADVRFDGTPVGPRSVETMLDRAAFRAPDGAGVWQNDEGTAALGQSAFWFREADRGVVDPHVAGGVVAVADSRLDNRDQLAASLSLPADSSDQALIAAGYERWQEGVVDRLLGDFALIVWDDRKQLLLLARDAMGMRPLYFARVSAERVVAASEVGQLLQHMGGALAPNRDVAIGHLWERSSLQRSAVAGVDQVAPGELVLCRSGTDPDRRTWWTPDPDHRITMSSPVDYAERLRELLVESVAARTKGTRPPGLMLSGGVDSGTIAATAGWLAESGGAEKLRTYSWASDAFPEIDERAISSRIADRFDLPSTPVDVDGALPLSGWPELAPFVGDAHHGVFTEGLVALLRAAANDGVGVMMSGDRGDLMTSGWVLKYPPLLRAGRLRELATEIGDQRRETDESLATIVARDLLRAGWRSVTKQLRRRGSAQAAGAPDFLRPETRAELDETGSSGNDDATWGYSGSMRQQLVTAPSISRNIVWTDLLHARHGLGFADPWSDRRIAEFVLAIPQHHLVRPGEVDAKRLPRAAVEPMIGAELAGSMRKAPPAALYHEGVRRAEHMLKHDLFADSRSAEMGLVDDSLVRSAISDFVGTGRQPRGLWPAISLEMWLRTHFS